jgi:hypothetical protein
VCSCDLFLLPVSYGDCSGKCRAVVVVTVIVRVCSGKCRVVVFVTVIVVVEFGGT